MKRYNYNPHVVFFVFLNLLIVISPKHLCGQEKYILSKEEMPEFGLIYEFVNTHTSFFEQLNKEITQIWEAVDSTKKCQVTIKYYDFSSIPGALSGTAKLSQRFPEPYYWGSPTKTIIGEDTWMYTDPRRNIQNGIFFVKGNIGVQIFISNVQESDPVYQISVTSKKILERIDQNLSPGILLSGNKTLSDSIENKESDFKIDEIRGILQEFTLTKPVISNWSVDSIQYRQGWRYEWKNDTRTLGVDLCQFKNVEETKFAAQIKKKNCCNVLESTFDLSSRDLKQKIANKFNHYLNSKESNQTFSVVGIKNNLAFHVYGFDVDENDSNTINEIIDVLAE